MDLRLALRNLRRRPGFTFMAVASLALALGANVAVFGVVDAILFRPFPVDDPQGLLRVQHVDSERGPGNPSHPDFEDYRRQVEGIAELASHARFTFSARIQERSERTSGELVTSNYFAVLGVEPFVGRAFLREEELAPTPVAVVSESLAERAFGGPAEALGEVLQVNGHAVTVLGVMPDRFRGIEVGVRHDLWIPLSMIDSMWPRAAEFHHRRDGAGGAVLARLEPGAAAETLQSSLATVAARIEDDGGEARALQVEVGPLERVRDVDQTHSYLAVLTGVVGLVLLIACLNIASLQLVELNNRSIELDVRSALGASRARVARLLLVENLLLYGVALAASFAVARVSAGVLTSQALFPIPLPALDVRADLRVFLFGAVIAAAAGTLFSLVPALRARRALRIGRTRVSRGRGMARGALLVAQLALAATLLSGSALLGRSLMRAYAVDPGYRLDDVLFLSVDLQGVAFRYDEPRTRQFYRDVVEGVRAVPGVANAAWSADIPFERMTIRTLFLPEHLDLAEEPDWITGDADIVTPGYLQTMGIPLVLGRDFRETDDREAPGVVIVNEAMARRYWPSESPIGKRLRVWGRMGIHHTPLRDRGRRPGRSVPIALRASGALCLLPARAAVLPEHEPARPRAGSGAAMASLPSVLEVISGLDDDLPVFDTRLLAEERSVALARQHTTARLFGISGVLALIVTALGAYSVTADAVSRRRREVGLRVAVGARANDIERMFFRDTIPPVLVGLALGAVCSLLGSRLVESLLVGLDRFDAPSYVASALVLAVAAGLACYVPARRASRVDPSIALRDDG